MTVFERVLRGEPPPVPRAAAPAPVAARRRRWQPAPWPAPLAAAVDRHALVGRGVELAYLERCWREATDGQRALVLLAGDAGIGKTRLAAELGRRAHDGGAVVLYGRFDEETLTPYQPVVEMLRGWSAGAPLDSLRERLGPRAAELAILLPEFGPPPADHLASGRSPARRPTRSASASSTRSPRCSARSAPTRRSCSSSTTCTGPTGRRCSCCATSCARPRRGGCCSSAPTARARSPTATRCTS